MDSTSNEASGRIESFLKKVVKIREKAAAIYTPPGLKNTVIKLVNKVFSGRKIQTIGLKTNEREQVEKIFRISLKEGSLLLILMDLSSHHMVVRQLEQILEEGHISFGLGGNWGKVEPVEGRQAVIWVDRSQIREDQFELKHLLNTKLVVEK